MKTRTLDFLASDVGQKKLDTDSGDASDSVSVVGDSDSVSDIGVIGPSSFSLVVYVWPAFEQLYVFPYIFFVRILFFDFKGGDIP